MKKVSRRAFVSGSLGVTAALTLPGFHASASVPGAVVKDSKAPEIIDTNVNLFEWPFRKLKYAETTALKEKLQQHRITQAWAGSFEALFHKDIRAVNRRLAEECGRKGNDMFVPFGTVNLSWPDWQEDLRVCHEVHKMPGIRLYPIYQAFDLKHPDFVELVRQVAKRKMLLQIVGDLEDIRHHHPIVEVRGFDFGPLPDILAEVPEAKVQLLYWNHRTPRNVMERLVKMPNVFLDTSRVEGAGEVGRLIHGKSWSGNPVAVPASQFVFGSHAPFFPVEANLIKLFEAPLTLTEITGIMNANARRLRQEV